MTHRYTKPINPIIHEYLGRPKWVIMKATSIGTIISGIATMLGVFILLYDEHMSIRILMSVLSPFFLEGMTHAFSQLFVEGVGNAIRQEQRRWTYAILSIVFFVCLGIVGSSNMYISIMASQNTVDYAFGEPEEKKPDYSIHNSLSDNAKTVFEQDSFDILVLSNKLSKDRKDSFDKSITSARNRLGELRQSYQSTKWYNDRIDEQLAKIKKARKGIRKLPKEIDKVKRDSFDAAKSRKLAIIDKAEKGRISEDMRVTELNASISKNHEKTKSHWKNIVTFLISIGVLSALIRYSYIELRNLLGGCDRIPKENPYEQKESLFIRAYDAFYMFFYSWMEYGIEKIEKASVDKQPKKQETEKEEEEIDKEEESKVFGIYDEYNEQDTKKLIDSTSKYYKRSFSSKKKVTRVSNLNKAEEGIRELRRIGYKVAKKDGKLSITRKVRKAK